jgi:hypothetical protein
MRTATLAAALGVLAITTASPADAQVTAAAPADRQRDVPWAVGETLEYGLKFMVFNVGQATLTVLGIDTIRGEPCYHVQFTIHGHALFYTLDDSLRSWFGVNDLVSRRFEQDVNDNGRQRSRHYEILPEQRLRIKNGTDTAETVAEPLDEVSFFYFARTLLFDEGQTYEFARYFEVDRNPITIRVLGRQSIDVPAGRFEAIAVRPIFKSGGLFGHGGTSVVWLSDDDARIPLRIRASMAVGTLEISLRSRTRAESRQ